MLSAILSSLILTRKRKLTQVFPQSWRKVWNILEIRVTVVLSLILQTILTLVGNKRKFSTSDKLRVILWLAYMSADSIATVSLSILSSSSGDDDDDDDDGFVDPKFTIKAFWAPFLLLHLGGPDTISAYSLEDNDLWLRHLLQLCVQVVVAVYVILMAWTNTTLNFLTIPMFIAGIIKSGERTWALWRVSRDHFRDSLLPEPDPGPNYARYMEEYKTKKAEGFDVSLGKLIGERSEVNNLQFHTVVEQNGIITETELLDYANNFFGIFKRLFADLILSFDDIQNSQAFFRNRSYDEAFKVIEIELGFSYDLFYTKAFLAHSSVSLSLRVISFSCIITVLGVFTLLKKEAYSDADVLITYVLLLGAIILEIYAVIVLLSSDWTMLKLGKYSNSVVGLLCQAISLIPLVRYRWSNKMAQYSFIGFCLKDRPTKCSVIQKTICIHNLLEKRRYKDLKAVPDGLKELVFQEFQKKLSDASDFKACKKFCTHRGDWVLEKAHCWDKLGWSIEAEFDQSILLWHIATDLCYYSDLNKNSNTNTIKGLHCEASRLLSHYMLYLLVMCPFMLPNGIGQTRLRDTCAEATEFFKEFGPISDGNNEACTMLSMVCTEIPPLDVKGDRCKSVLFDACRLAKALESLETEEEWERTKKWELICHVWIELLSYAASQCQWSDHAQQLRRGGELLTHVWLLMAHLGITEQFQISQGHARVKLIVQ